MTVQPRHYYTLFMFLALVVFLLARRFTPKSPGLEQEPWWKRVTLILAAFGGGAFGAKVPFAVEAIVTGDVSILSHQAWLTDGKTITTALLGAYLAIEIAKRALEIKAKTGDSFAIPVALALAVGRFGCFFNGCCYGMATTMPWGVVYPNAGLEPRHPTQIYEVLFHLGMALLLWRITVAGLFKNQRFKLYLICYGLFRFLTEYIRPEKPLWLGLTFYQWVALLMIFVMVVHWIIDERAKSRELRPVSNPC